MPADAQTTRKGILIILSSPSGAGKSSLSHRLIRELGDIRFSISATTRKPRTRERDGKDYYFRTREDFQRMIERGEMLEHAEVFGNFYGSPRAPVVEAIESGADIIFDVDWQGGQQIRNSTLGDRTVSIFILPPSIAELEARLRRRNEDDETVIQRRMSEARAEISHWAEYDYVLINDDFERCAADLRGIVETERLRRDRQPGLVDHVQRLNAEFEGSVR